jgi:hypothetical protein
VPAHAEPGKFTYPVWPPAPLVDLVHWWGRSFDPLLMVRPPFWLVTIWWDALVFGPFYVAALWAFKAGDERIREWTIMYSAFILPIVACICAEEVWGSTPALNQALVLGANAPWFLLPLSLLVRMLFDRHPFTAPK